MFFKAKNKALYFLAISSVILLVMLLGLSLSASNSVHASAQTIELENVSGQTFEKIAVYSSDNRNENPVDLNIYDINDFTSVNYIPNKNYFLLNPQHAVNDGSGNVAGTCTTVAMQLLMGYHNYYSDRRLIPEIGENDRVFLNENYGDIYSDPVFPRSMALGQGCAIIGTEDGVYEEIFELTDFSSFPALGQAVGLVTNGAGKFVEKYASDISKNVSLRSGFFTISDAISDPMPEDLLS